MIDADINGKTKVAEDVFTSNCIGLLSLLPDENLISFLSQAKDVNGCAINLAKYNIIEKLEFWPWLPEAGEPDVICVLKNNNNRMTLVIEIKQGAGKSSHASSQNDTRLSTDQLAKYWQAASQQDENVALIYLTHHQHMPVQELRGCFGKNEKSFSENEKDSLKNQLKVRSHRT